MCVKISNPVKYCHVILQRLFKDFGRQLIASTNPSNIKYSILSGMTGFQQINYCMSYGIVV